MSERMNKNTIFTLCSGILVAFIAVFVPALWKELDCDSVYYIAMAERISEGMTPYVNLRLIYPPLWFYIAAALKTLLHIPIGCHLFYELLHLTYLTGVVILTYKIARLWDVRKEIAQFGAFFVVMASMLVNGHSILLEIPSCFFGLLSLWMILQEKKNRLWTYPLAGLVAACAFLTKQYGLGFFALDLYAILFLCGKNHLQSCYRALLFVLGYAIPLGLCMIYWGDAIINSTLLNGYGTVTAEDAGWNTSITDRMMQIGSCLLHFDYWICPMVIGALVYIKCAIERKKIAQMLFAYLGIAGFSLQFYFSCYDHYMLFLIPFAALLTMVALEVGEGKFLLFRRLMIAWLIVVPILYHFGYDCYQEMAVEGKLKSRQYVLAEQVEDYIQPGDTVWVSHYGLYHLYMTAQFFPPNIETIGYSFGPLGINKTEAFEQAKNSNWVVRTNPISVYETFFTDSLLEYLETHESIYLNDNNIVLYKIK